MNGIGQRYFVVVLALALAACGDARVDASDQTVTAYNDAFNARDVDAMLAMVHDDANWVSIRGTRATPMAGGLEALREALLEYFAANPTARSRLISAERHGDFVQAFEEASWERDGETKRQCAASVYELRDGQIANVWYFDARPCDGAN
ncbi:MAG: nuclear transport factor 2 family protein [Pseudomonadota bacterium]